MRKLLPIEDEPSYLKDSYSSALINTDVNMLAEYKSRKKAAKEISALKQEINNLKSEINSIKSFLNLR